MMDTSHWQNKVKEELTLLELAYAHLGISGIYRLKDGFLESILPLTLREINHARHMEYSKNFVPIVGAFAIVEQVGFAYRSLEKEPYSNDNASAIMKALYYFASYDEDNEDLKAIYALRNSFMHNASLMSKAERKNKPSYYFQFDRSIETLFRYPDTAWDGLIENFNFLNTTLVNPNKVIDLAEIVVDSARQCLKEGSLEVILEDGQPELFYRYLKCRSY